jgi:plastocyanin
VTPGGRVRWVNKGKRVHNVNDFAGSWGSRAIRPGQSFTFKLPGSLNYYYYCSHHPLEMSGSIIVRPAPPDGGPKQGGGYQGQGQGSNGNPYNR